MQITNNTSVIISISGKKLAPNTSSNFDETMFCSTSIHSNIGSCRVITEYSKRSFENFGKINAVEGKRKDKNGLKEILVCER